MSQKDDIDAAILHAAVFGSVAGNRVKLRVTCGGEICGVDGAVFEEQAGDGGGSRGGELPVAGKLSGVYRDVIGVAFDAQGGRGESFGEDGDHGDRCGTDLSGTGREESCLV